MNKTITVNGMDLRQYHDAKLVEFINKRYDYGVYRNQYENLHIDVDILMNRLIDIGYISIRENSYSMVFHNNDTHITARIVDYNTLVGLEIYSIDMDYHKTIKIILDEISTNLVSIRYKWIMSTTDGVVRYKYFNQEYDNIVYDCVYPNIEVGLDNYINDFLNSNSPILILIGEPGTGKTRFIQNILKRMNKLTYLSYSKEVLGNDDVFAEFVTDNISGAFVIEDAEFLLSDRLSGNELMSKFLNVGDGIIRLNGRKMIFSTNLPSTRDIDPAIMRPGRCYDVLNFRRLTYDESNIVCDKYNLPKMDENTSYTLTEIFNRKVTKKQNNFGFA